MRATQLSDGIQIYALSMGKVFRVTHVVPTVEDSNKAMEQDSKVALIAIDNNGLHYLAQKHGSVAPSAILRDLEGAQ